MSAELELEYEWRCIYCGADTVVLRVRKDAYLGPAVNETTCTCGTLGYVPVEESEEY